MPHYKTGGVEFERAFRRQGESNERGCQVALLLCPCCLILTIIFLNQLNERAMLNHWSTPLRWIYNFALRGYSCSYTEGSAISDTSLLKSLTTRQCRDTTCRQQELWLVSMGLLVLFLPSFWYQQKLLRVKWEMWRRTLLSVHFQKPTSPATANERT